MKFKVFPVVSSTLSVLLFVSILGCGGSVAKILTPPPLKESKKIVVVPFVSSKPDKDITEMGRQISYNIATRLGLLVKEAEWVYDQSGNLNPVSKEMGNLNLSPAEIVKSDQLAAKLGKSMNADLVIVGEVRKPNIKKDDHSEILRPHQKYAGIAGTSKYVRTVQKATVVIVVKVIDTNSGKPIFSDPVQGYIKYWFAYQTQQRGQVVFKEKEQIYADLNNHLTKRIIHDLHPMGTPDTDLPEVLLKPKLILVGSAGPVKFD